MPSTINCVRIWAHQANSGFFVGTPSKLRYCYFLRGHQTKIVPSKQPAKAPGPQGHSLQFVGFPSKARGQGPTKGILGKQLAPFSQVQHLAVPSAAERRPGGKRSAQTGVRWVWSSLCRMSSKRNTPRIFRIPIWMHISSIPQLVVGLVV